MSFFAEGFNPCSKGGEMRERTYKVFKPVPPIFTERDRLDSQWMTEHAQELVEKYPDRWVAVYKCRVVAVGDNAAEVARLAKEREGQDCQPVIAFVEGKAYVY
jgi:hypothetical protein